LSILYCFLTTLNFVVGQGATKNYHFAVGIFTSSHSQMLTYAVILETGGVIISSQVMDEQRFMYYIMGHWPTVANPQKINLLEANGVDSCFLWANDKNKIIGYYAKPFQFLWKLRYKTNPYKYDEDGWSHKYYKPSESQARFLYENYGVKNLLIDFFVGENLYKLLRDVQNQEWVDSYIYVPDEAIDSSQQNINSN